MAKEIRQTLSVTATNPDTFYFPAVKGIINAVSFNLSAGYISALGAGTATFVLTENGGANREIINRAENTDFVHIPSLASQAADGTADGTRQVVGIADRGLVLTISGTIVEANAVEVTIVIIDDK